MEFISDVIGHIDEGRIFLHIRNLDLYKLELDSKFVSPNFDGTCCAVGIRHLQTAFCLLMLGYVLAVVYNNNNNNNNNNNPTYLLQLGCYPVAVVILHVNKT